MWLAGLAIFSSLISLYYYLQVIRQMYIEPALAEHEIPESNDSHSPESADAPGAVGESSDPAGARLFGCSGH